MRVAVIGHVEHITLGRVARVPGPGEIAHATEVRTFAGGGGGIAFFQLASSPGEVHLFTALGAIQTVTQRHPVLRNMQTIIPHAEIARFNEEFVSLFTLARERGKHMPILLRDLQALGVQPAPELVGVGATFFRRSEVPL